MTDPVTPRDTSLTSSSSSASSTNMVVFACLAAVAGFVIGVVPRFLPVIVCLLGIVCVVDSIRSGQPVIQVRKGLGLSMGAFVGWVALSALWSGDASGGLAKAGALSVMIGAGLCIAAWGSRQDARAAIHIGAGLFAGWCTAVAWIGLEHLTGQALIETIAWWVPAFKPSSSSTFIQADGSVVIELYNRGIGGLIMVAPLAVYSGWVSLSQRSERSDFATVLAAVSTVALLLIIAASGCGTCKLASSSLAASLMAIVLFGVGVGLLFARGALLIVLAGAPLIAAGVYAAGDRLSGYSPTVSERVVIWGSAIDAIWERPIVGHGVRSTRREHKAFMKQYPETARPFTVKVPGHHPHNGYLQIWRELGLVGALLGGLLAWHLTAGVQGRARALVTVFMLAAVGGVLATGWGLWQTWLLAALALLPALAVTIVRADHGALREDG